MKLARASLSTLINQVCRTKQVTSTTLVKIKIAKMFDAGGISKMDIQRRKQSN